MAGIIYGQPAASIRTPLSTSYILRNIIWVPNPKSTKEANAAVSKFIANYLADQSLDFIDYDNRNGILNFYYYTEGIINGIFDSFETYYGEINQLLFGDTTYKYDSLWYESCFCISPGFGNNNIPQYPRTSNNHYLLLNVKYDSTFENMCINEQYSDALEWFKENVWENLTREHRKAPDTYLGWLYADLWSGVVTVPAKCWNAAKIRAQNRYFQVPGVDEDKLPSGFDIFKSGEEVPLSVACSAMYDGYGGTIPSILCSVYFIGSASTNIASGSCNLLQNGTYRTQWTNTLSSSSQKVIYSIRTLFYSPSLPGYKYDLYVNDSLIAEDVNFSQSLGTSYALSSPITINGYPTTIKVRFNVHV